MRLLDLDYRDSLHGTSVDAHAGEWEVMPIGQHSRNFTWPIRRAMDIANIKLTLMERLMLVWDEASLRRIGAAIETEITEEKGMDGYTDEEIAELDRRQARHLSGESKSYTHEEAMRMMREGFKG